MCNWTSGGQKKTWQACRLSATGEQYLKVMDLKKIQQSNLTQDLKNTFDPWANVPIYCSPKPNQKCTQCKGGSQKAIHNDGKEEDKDWSKSVAKGLMIAICNTQ